MANMRRPKTAIKVGVITISIVGIIVAILYLYAVIYTLVNTGHVCVPLHVNLNEDLYIVLKTDTILTESINFKSVYYLERSKDE